MFHLSIDGSIATILIDRGGSANAVPYPLGRSRLFLRRVRPHRTGGAGDQSWPEEAVSRRDGERVQPNPIGQRFENHFVTPECTERLHAYKSGKAEARRVAL